MMILKFFIFVSINWKFYSERKKEAYKHIPGDNNLGNADLTIAVSCVFKNIKKQPK